MRKALIVATLVALSACAGRPPVQIAVVQPQDREATCLEIVAQLNANNAQMADLAGEQGAKVAQNVAAGVAGLFIWPLWFAMDFQGTAGKEALSLQNRQQYLTALAAQKHCS